MWSNSKWINNIIISLLFLTGFGFLGRPSIVMLVTFVLVIFATKFNVYVSLDLIYLLVFCVLLIIFGIFDGVSNSIRSVSFLAAFVVGNTMQGSKEKNIRFVIIIFSFSMALHVLLNFTYDYMMQGNRIMSTMNHYDLWSDSFLSVTGLMTNATCFCAIFYYLVVFSERLIQKVILSILFVLIIAYDIIIGGRTLVLITAICLFVSIAMHFLSVVHQPASKKKALKYVVVFVITIFLIFNVIRFFWPRILAFTSNTYFFRRFGENRSMILYDTRLRIMIDYYKVFFKYPFGGGKAFADIGTLPHELWLEFFNIGGILPYVMFVFYSNRMFFKIGIFSMKKKSSDFIILLLPFAIGLLIQFFLEPVFSGAPVLLLLFIMITGILTNKRTPNYESRKEVSI